MCIYGRGTVILDVFCIVFLYVTESLTPQTIHPYGPWYDITLTGQEVSTTVADVTTTEAPDLGKLSHTYHDMSV